MWWGWGRKKRWRGKGRRRRKNQSKGVKEAKQEVNLFVVYLGKGVSVFCHIVFIKSESLSPTSGEDDTKGHTTRKWNHWRPSRRSPTLKRQGAGGIAVFISGIGKDGKGPDLETSFTLDMMSMKGQDAFY